MSLKSYISIKFVVYIIVYSIVALLSYNVIASYQNLKHQNEELFKQKSYFEAILNLNPEDFEGKEKLNHLIEKSNEKIDTKIDSSTFEIDVFILISLILFSRWILSIIETKIDQLKKVESHSEKLKML